MGSGIPLLDDPHSYLEASATAGFAYGILKAIRKRYVGAEYTEVAEKAIRGIVRNISPEGNCCKPRLVPGWAPISIFLPANSAHLYAVRPGDGDSLSDGVSAQIFLIAA